MEIEKQMEPFHLMSGFSHALGVNAHFFVLMLVQLHLENVLIFQTIFYSCFFSKTYILTVLFTKSFPVRYCQQMQKQTSIAFLVNKNNARKNL